MIDEIKALIIESLNLSDIAPSEIDARAPLFSDENGGLGLDSVDALELGLVIQKQYNIRIDSKTQNLREIFYSVESLANYISENGKNV